jgi:hypothetical protein
MAARVRRPRTKLRAETKSALVSLRDNLAAIDAHVVSIQRPVHAVRDLIGQVKAPLAFPGRLHQDLTDLHRLLASLRTTVTPLAILPGPIGPAARGLKQALEALAGPPASGSIGRARDVAGKVDKALKPLRDLVAKIEKPVAEAAATIDQIQASVAYLRDMVARVVAHYGTAPPADVEACAAKLNEPVAAFRAALDVAAARISTFFATIEAALRAALAVLKPVGDVVRTVQKVLGVFRGKAMKAVLNALERFSNGIKPYVDKVEFVVRRAIDSVLKKLGINVSAFTGFFRKVIGALDPMKSVERAVNAALASVKAFVAKLVDATGVAALLEELAALKRQLAQAVEAFLRSRCKAVLDPDSGRFAPAVSRRR